jgi:hypothetical protein
MKIYRLTLCLQLVIARLKKFNLNEYNSERPIIFVEANDPDEACYRAIYNLTNMIIKQDSSKETLELLKELIYDIRVIKIGIPQ